MNVSVSTVRRWSDKGMLKCYHVGSRRDRRYRRRDILDFFKRHTRHLCIDENQEMSPRTAAATGDPCISTESLSSRTESGHSSPRKLEARKSRA